MRKLILALLVSQITLVIMMFAGFAGLAIGGFWLMTRPTVYDFGNGTKLVVPWGTVSVDQREKGYGVVVQSGVNVTVCNDSDEWRSLTVSYRKPNYPILDTHAFEDLAPKASKVFGADPIRYDGMHVSISKFAQEKRDKSTN